MLDLDESGDCGKPVNAGAYNDYACPVDGAVSIDFDHPVNAAVSGVSPGSDDSGDAVTPEVSASTGTASSGRPSPSAYGTRGMPRPSVRGPHNAVIEYPF